MTTNPILNEISIPTVDISAETGRHVVIAQGTERIWNGHPSTVLLPDGKTMFCSWPSRNDGTGAHGAPFGSLVRSDDGGLTWSKPLPVPANWRETGRGHPTIHRVVDGDGVARLFVLCRDENRTTFLRGVSTDDGKTWSVLEPLPVAGTGAPAITGWTAPITIVEAARPGGARTHLMWYERGRDGAPTEGVGWQSASYDGG